MGGRRRARGRRAVTTALLAAATALVMAAGCTTSGGTPDDGRGHDSGTARSRGPEQGSVLAVKIDNVRAARPQAGLDAADVVYVEQVEGGLSRLMAVYATRLPEVVGPVRSARESDLELLRQFDRPTLAFSGAQSKLLPLIDRAPLLARTPADSDGAWFRDTGRQAPHNLYLHPDGLLPSPAGRAALTTGFRYGPAPSGGTAQDRRTVDYPSADFAFTWSARRHRYLVDMDGKRAVTPGGEPVAPATVVVQYVEIRPSEYQDFLGNHTPYTETVGSGKALVLRDGRTYDATWNRPQAAGGTEFTAPDGSPMTFAAGQVWVVFAKR
ncbi:DUF3048 domain-containing protein [Streptomyces sp. MS06]|uniref:DUF3048 domain-containing protein n=1 Tax=Streptomyces sp. MS06 TaxID=3385974 RepID=UPI00399F6D50